MSAITVALARLRSPTVMHGILINPVSDALRESICEPSKANQDPGDQPSNSAHRDKNPEVVSAYQAVTQKGNRAEGKRGKPSASHRTQHNKEDTQ
jgi:hypothetical protein